MPHSANASRPPYPSTPPAYGTSCSSKQTFWVLIPTCSADSQPAVYAAARVHLSRVSHRRVSHTHLADLRGGGGTRSNLKEVNLDLETQYLRAQRAEFRFTLAVPSRGNVEGVVFYYPYSMDTETVPDDSGLAKAATALPGIPEGLTQGTDQVRRLMCVGLLSGQAGR